MRMIVKKFALSLPRFPVCGLTKRAPDLGYAPRFFELFRGFGLLPFRG